MTHMYLTAIYYSELQDLEKFAVTLAHFEKTKIEFIVARDFNIDLLNIKEKQYLINALNLLVHKVIFHRITLQTRLSS